MVWDGMGRSKARPLSLPGRGPRREKYFVFVFGVGMGKKVIGSWVFLDFFLEQNIGCSIYSS